MNKPSYVQSAALLDRAKKVLAGGVSSEFRKYNYPHAMFYTHGKGSRIYDVDGNEYLDFTLSQGPLILGHSHPRVLEAIREYSEKGQLFAGQHIREIELAEKLQRMIPSAERIRFCLDGSEAVQTAFRIARAKTGRPKFLRFEGHYHGWMDNVCWGLSTPSLDALGDRENPNVFPWSEGLSAHASKDFIILPWNDLDLLKKIVAERHDEIAAIITEPIMCNNGCITPQPGFLAGLREVCDLYNIGLIFDEVICGFRVSPGGAQLHYGITPDLSVFAKAIASGYPISAIVGRAEWMNLIETGQVIHAGTMNSGNPSVAAALATLDLLEEDGLYERLFRYGEALRNGLRECGRQTNQNLVVQGYGPILHTAFSDQGEAKDYRATLAHDKKKLGKFIAGMHDSGIRVIGRGLWYISAAHEDKDIDQAIETARKVLKTL